MAKKAVKKEKKEKAPKRAVFSLKAKVVTSEGKVVSRTALRNRMKTLVAGLTDVAEGFKLTDFTIGGDVNTD